MNEVAPPRYPLPNPLTELLCLTPHESEMQDWPLEVSDETRVPEFCDFYDAATIDRDTRFALMALIIFSLDDAIQGNIAGTDAVERRVDRLLRRDFALHFHLVNYWRCHDNEVDPDPLPESEQGFLVTPMMRRIWKDCFKPEYSRWLESYDPQ